MIQFVANYEDLSTDRGFQFRFYCDKCGNGFMSEFQTSAVGVAGSLLRAAGGLFGGWMSSAGHSAYEIQRATGGAGHDAALRDAVSEGKAHFHQCSRCGKWVCPEVCWNAAAVQCEECAPDFGEELAASQAQAKAEAARQQLYEKAQQTDYVSGVDMGAGSQLAAPRDGTKRAGTGAGRRESAAACASCGHDLGAAKFCPECGEPARPAVPECAACGCRPDKPAKFCPECGARMNV
ncbi:MAG TPA: zinc ribbon domain-containing protein [Pyrinomonadaceae bacterium]|nr:zinc ribbon domain-containing protein [Pyrinomonadaceae bacterium]